MSEPDWLTWTRELQAIAQTGLAFSRDQYDRERYEMLRSLAARMAAGHTSTPADRIESLFAAQTGYATPKVDVRAAVFDGEGRILMVREAADGCWTLPGGFADVNLTPAENVAKEVREESGFEVTVRKLAAVWDRARQGHPPSMFSCCKLFYVCELAGGVATTGPETTAIAWFAESAVPIDLSVGRVLPRQIARLFEHFHNPALPADFE
jgi:ADP-ribose pyrophosphatase YjhB (NUDIX family)